MIALGAFAAAGMASLGLWLVSRSMFAAPVVQRRNIRGVDVPVGAGVVMVMAAVAVEAALSLFDVAGRDAGAAELAGRRGTMVAALGFGLLGLLDDLAADGDDKGFRGHLVSMGRGRLTTGGAKLVGGGAVAVVAVTTGGAVSVPEALVGAAVVALAANVGNLLDRAPGRTTKVALVAGAVLVATTAAGARSALTGTVVILGAALGLLAFDLRERLMLGDAGANVLGAALGLGATIAVGLRAQVVLLAVLVGLNLASEAVSFSRVIDRVPPLRVLDRCGRLPLDGDGPAGSSRGRRRPR